MAKENLTAIKTLVFSMGVVLVFGTAFLIAVVWKKTHEQNFAASECPGGHVDLKGHGQLADFSVHGQNVYATFQKADGQLETVTIDPCSGRVLSALTLDMDSLPPDQ